MRLGDIDFPQELIAAIRDGTLVVFAGAGVSKGQPANLPLFDELADSIAEGSGEILGTGEAIDQFLGRLASEIGIEVNEIAAQVLTASVPRPTELHKDLLRLFKGGLRSVRLVTTNFDLLFEAAAEEIYATSPTCFRASALPRGDEFAGIVHVHGDVTVIPDMVLTDADFGKAYLVGGWARRFLVALFQTSPVLFVGYSHSDVIMEYLARAIPVTPDVPRFILTDDGDIAKWERLGTQPVMFPPGDFAAQNDAISNLATAVNRGATDWSEWIRNIVNAPPMLLSDDDAEILAFGISDSGDAVTNVIAFATNADNPEWIAWLNQRGVLDNLFAEGEFSRIDSILAEWLASKFARREADTVLRLIGLKNMHLNPKFWYWLAIHIGKDDNEGDDPLSSGDLGRWMSVFLAQASNLLEVSFVQLLERCVEFERFDDALAIFDRLVEPKVMRISLIGDRSFGDAEVAIGCDRWNLERAKAAFSPHLSAVADSLLRIASRHLASQHRQLVTWELADRNFSQSSLHRERIRDEADPNSATAEDVLIDLARDALIQLAHIEPLRAESWINVFVSSDVPILRRMARIAMIELQE